MKSLKRKFLILSAVLLVMGSILSSSLGGINAVNGEKRVNACFTISPKHPKAGQKITFDASCTSSDTPIVNYAWDFQDDGQDDKWGRTVSWTYGKSDIYKVELWVKDSHGNTDKVWKEVNVSGGEGFTPPQETGIWGVLTFSPSSAFCSDSSFLCR